MKKHNFLLVDSCVACAFLGVQSMRVLADVYVPMFLEVVVVVVTAAMLIARSSDPGSTLEYEYCERYSPNFTNQPSIFM